MSRTWIVGSALVVGIAIQIPASPMAHEGAAGTAARFKAVAFDSFVLFDPDSVVPRAEEVFPGKVANCWLEVVWLSNVLGQSGESAD